MVFTIWAGEMVQAAFVVRAYMGGEVSSPREGAGTEWALEAEIWEEWRHSCLRMVMAILFFTE